MKMEQLRYLYGTIIVLIFWEVVHNLEIFNELLLPSPIVVVSSLLALLVDTLVYESLMMTLMRTLAGLLGGLFAGITLGLIIGQFKKIYQSLEFIIDFLRSIPPAALIPVFLLFFGIDEMAKIMLVSVSVGLIMLINTMYGVNHANELRLTVAKSMRLTKKKIFVHVVFPEALPYISTGIRLAISFSLMLTVVTEMLMPTTLGLGKLILDYHLVYEIPQMYAIILVTGILGYMINKLYLLSEKKMLHWVGK